MFIEFVSLQRSIYKVFHCRFINLIPFSFKIHILSKKVSYLPQEKDQYYYRETKTFLFSYGSLKLQMLQ